MRLPMLVVLAAIALMPSARATGVGAPPADGADHVLCDMATAQAERETGVPDELLTAISRVETGRRDPGTGAVRSWPWTIDVEGQGHFYATKGEAIAAVEAFQAAGARSIDVGCMQINLLQHPDAFPSLSEAFDPATNALWAARFLTGLFRQTGSWPHAAAAYHSMTPDIGADYQEQVLRMWAAGDGAPESPSLRGTEQASATEQASTAASPPSSGDGRSGGSPFGADRAPVVAARYGADAGRVGGSGRGLGSYRAMPIAMNGRLPVEARFSGS